MAQALTPRRIWLMRHSFQVVAIPALGLGLLAALWPRRFWGALGLDVGQDAVLALLYACVLMAVGCLAALGARKPQAHADLWLFMGIYKGAAFLVLCAHLWTQAAPPLAGWVIALMYLALSIYTLLLYPWDQA
jgi:hypothetical protein